MVGQVFNQKKKSEGPVFSGTGVSLGSSVSNQQHQQLSDQDLALIEQYGEDPELLMAIKASMNEDLLNNLIIVEEPPKEADTNLVCQVQMRGPNNEKFVRRFWRSLTSIQDLINYYKKQINQNVSVQLFITFPKKDLNDPTKTLE